MSREKTSGDNSPEMVYGKKRTRIILFCSSLLLILSGSGALSANPDQFSTALQEKLYKKALVDLNSDIPEAKVRSALFLAARKNPRYVRAIGRELVRHLEKSHPYLNLAKNDPYVKNYLAFSLGEIGHEEGLYYLLQALEKTKGILEEEQTRLEDLQKRENKFSEEGNIENGITKPEDINKFSINRNSIPRVVMKRSSMGPAQFKKFDDNTMVLPHSPDVYWSVSDEFKSAAAYDSKDGYHRVRIRGFNYVNVASSILIAIGKIGFVSQERSKISRVKIDKDTVKKVIEYLVHDIPDIRSSAATALGYLARGQVGTLEALEALEKRFTEEKNGSVKVYICSSILFVQRHRTKYYYELLNLLKSRDNYVRFDAALALRDLKMGESASALKAALKLEEEDYIRGVLKQAIYNAELDNVTPVNY